MKKLFLILLPLILFVPGCDDSTVESDTTYVQVFEKSFRYGHFPEAAYTEVYDAMISSDNPDTNMDDGPLLSLSELTGSEDRMLIDFNLGGYLPAEAVVTRAILTLQIEDMNPADVNEPVPVQIYAMRESWDVLAVTWNFTGSELWGTPGGVYDVSDLMDTVYIPDTMRTYVDLELDTAYIQEMIESSTYTYGFLLKLADGDASTIQFTSNEATGSEPLLTVYYH